MKRRYLTASLLLQTISAGAFAQSSVTLYGTIDNGLTYINNYLGQSVVKMQDGINRSNTLGFTGTEDLGGGMHTVFKLENGYSANTGALGQGGLMFGKQAYVGIGQNTIGDVSLGRQYDYMYSALFRYFPCQSCGILGVENADLDRMSGERLNNSVQFTSANLAGLQFGAMYAFGQNSGATSTNLGRAISANVVYAYGPFSAGFAMTDINKAPIYAGLTGAPALLGQPLRPATVLVVDNQRIFGAGAIYTLGNGRASVLYTNTRLQLNGLSATDQVLHVGGDYHVLPDLILAGKVTFDRLDNSRWYSATAGIDYFLSKATDIYVDLVAQKATGAGTVASIALTAPSSTNQQFVSRVGMKHLF